MKITEVQAVYPNYRQPLKGWRPYLWQIVVRVETDAGVSWLRLRWRPPGGEHDLTPHRFAAIARAGALDIWQPDVTWYGGITATLRIVEQAQAAGVPAVLHRGGEPWGLHVIAGTACADLAELVLGNRHRAQEKLWLDAPEPEDGCLTLGDGPGFGVRLNESILV